MIDYALSSSDLLLVDGFKTALESNDHGAIEKFLFANGMDISKHVSERVCAHRNLRGKVVGGIRYEGYERQDKEWLQSGAASIENIIDSTDDKSLRKDLRVMSYQPGHVQAWPTKE